MLFGETPTPLPHSEAQRLLAAFADGPVDKAAVPRIQAGMRAVVEEGPFVGNEGMCTDSDNDSAQLMLHVLGRMMPLDFPHEALREA
jgi:transcription antitermination factor NusG